jgi:predicted phage tail protein
MTNIILHGILAKEFGENFQMKIYKAKNVLKAIDANRINFINRINELSQEGFNYTVIVDGKKINQLEELDAQKEPQKIDLVPLIIGAGGVALVSVITGIATSAITAGTGAFFAASVINAVLLTVVSVGLQMLLAPKPDAPAAISSTTKAMQQSFSFSNKNNVASQGSPVPFGYGRLKIGSQVIQTTLKSFQQKSDSVESMKSNALQSLNNIASNSGGISKRNI